MSRMFPVILVSLLVNFFLFLMMTQMLTGKKLKPKEQVDFQGIELIDFKTQDKASKKNKPAKAERPLFPEAPPPLSSQCKTSSPQQKSTNSKSSKYSVLKREPLKSPRLK